LRSCVGAYSYTGKSKYKNAKAYTKSFKNNYKIKPGFKNKEILSKLWSYILYSIPTWSRLFHNSTKEGLGWDHFHHLIPLIPHSCCLLEAFIISVYFHWLVSHYYSAAFTVTSSFLKLLHYFQDDTLVRILIFPNSY
jgi:hypothetical protein